MDFVLENSYSYVTRNYSLNMYMYKIFFNGRIHSELYLTELLELLNAHKYCKHANIKVATNKTFCFQTVHVSHRMEDILPRVLKIA